MKKHTKGISLAIVAMILIGLSACDHGGGHASKGIELHKAVYKSALKNQDLGVATNAIYHILELSPKDSTYRDSLSILYFNGRMYPQAILLGSKLLEQRPGDTLILEMLAISKESLGIMEEALEHYKELYLATKKPYYLYQSASIQYNMRRYAECNSSVDAILALKNIEKETISITYGQGRSQKVPLSSAAINIKGVLAMANKQNEVAKQLFQQALKIFPEFQLASANLQALESGGVGQAAGR